MGEEGSYCNTTYLNQIEAFEGLHKRLRLVVRLAEAGLQIKLLSDQCLEFVDALMRDLRGPLKEDLLRHLPWVSAQGLQGVQGVACTAHSCGKAIGVVWGDAGWIRKKMMTRRGKEEDVGTYCFRPGKEREKNKGGGAATTALPYRVRKKSIASCAFADIAEPVCPSSFTVVSTCARNGRLFVARPSSSAA